MLIFVTGAASFIGLATTKELIAVGHQVVGLARSDDNENILERLGAESLRGPLQDHGSLQRGALEADGVIHLAFIHDFSDYAETGAIDKAAIEVMGEALSGSNKPFIVTSGTGLVAPDVVVTEDMRRDDTTPFPRVPEQAGLAFASRGVRSMVVRLPQVHGADGKPGLITNLVRIARQKQRAFYVNEGNERWAAAYGADVALLYRLAIERGENNAIYHADGEEGVRMRDIAEVIGKTVQMPAVSISGDQVSDYYGPLAMLPGFICRPQVHRPKSFSAGIPRELAYSMILAGRAISTCD